MKNKQEIAANTIETLREYLPKLISAIDQLESCDNEEEMNLDLLSQTIEGLHWSEQAMSLLDAGSLLAWLESINVDLTNGNYVKAVHTCSFCIRPALKEWLNQYTKKSTTLIIFSKDRAMQLEATLRSFFLHCLDPDGAEVVIIYKATKELYSAQYQRLTRNYPYCRFVEEGNFRNDLHLSVKRNEFVLFSVDDNMFVSSFSLGELIQLLSQHTQAIGVSMRLGENTTYCYSLSSTQNLPKFMRTEHPSVVEYVWSDAAYDFGYPLEVSSSFYRVNDIMPVLENIGYRNPNELEVQLSSFAHLYKGVRDTLLCFRTSKAFCNPINIVQNTYENKAGTKFSYSVEDLSNLFEQGYRIDVSKYKDFVAESCHQEVDLFFIEPASHLRSKSFQVSKFLPESPNEVLNYLKDRNLVKNGKIRLHLGCGETFLEDYINIDYPPDSHNVMQIKAEVYADIMKMLFPDDSVDEIRLHHVFEHFNRVTALALLIHWHSWLKVGGILHIETPDLMGSAKTLVSNAPYDVKMGVIRHLAGDQAASWAYHIDHWFPERYEVTLQQLGFDIINVSTSNWSQKPYLSNVEVVARKSREVSMEVQLRAAEALLWHSTVSPVEKDTHKIWVQQLKEMVLTEAISNVNFTGFHHLRNNHQETPIAEIHNFNQLERDNWVRSKASLIPNGSKVLDVGAGTCPYKGLFAHCEYYTHDFKQYEGIKLGGTDKYGQIDYASDIINIPVPDNSFDIILCTEVLEHVPEPIKALEEMARILKPGGKILITAPLGSGLHQLPYHYYGGYTPEWYRHFFTKYQLDVIDIVPNGGFFKHLAQECARVAWTFQQHSHFHGNQTQEVFQMFNEILPRYLFNLDSKYRIEEHTVGFHVEGSKKYPIITNLKSTSHETKQKAVIEYANKFMLSTFVETGTYLGDMINAVKSEFDTLYSIELQTELYQKAEALFKDDPKVTILNGDSGKVLEDVLGNCNLPCLFWLDGHYSEGITAKGEMNTPVMKELEHIFNHHVKDHVILIDDARLFNGKDDYPTFQQVTELIRRRSAVHTVEVKDDIIRIIP